MTPTLQNRLRNEVWAIDPGYIASIFESIERASSILNFNPEQRHPLVDRFGETAIITVSGALGKRLDDFEKYWMGMGDYDEIASAIDSVSESELVVFHFDCPGGVVTGCPELADKIRGMDVRTVAFTDTMMTSAAYWLGSQCDAVYASPSSRVGSIGCRNMHIDQSGWLEKLGMKISEFGKGKHKADYSPFRPLRDDEKKSLQDSVDKVHGQFRRAVEMKRAPEAEVYESKCYDSDEAIGLGLIDGHVSSLQELLGFLG